MNQPTMPSQSSKQGAVQPARILQVAFACHPKTSMEKRIGWHRAVIAAREHNVTVLCGPGTPIDDLHAQAKELGLGDRLRFIEVCGSHLSRSLQKTATTYYLGYQLWHKAAYKLAKQLHQETPFDLVHQTTFCGFREPGYCWKLDVPFIWGPVGGTQSYPLRYLTELSPQAAWIELCRNAINAWQLRFSSRVRSAAKKCVVGIAATRRAQSDLQRTLKLETTVQLETALDFAAGEPRTPRKIGQPINLLWAGRLRAWKTLPLLLKALAKVDKSVDFRLRVLGVGDCEQRWKRLAKRLGVNDRIEWLGWPEYSQTLPHYRWADANVFTSMRDTSGTGLHESLAMGTPILGVDHQGAADIMTDACAIRLPVDSPRHTIEALTAGIERLAKDLEYWKSLSDGALLEARNCTWENQATTTLGWYQQALECHASQIANHSKKTPPSADTAQQYLHTLSKSNWNPSKHHFESPTTST